MSENQKWGCFVNGKLAFYGLPDFSIVAPCIGFVHEQDRGEVLYPIGECGNKSVHQVERFQIGSLVYDFGIPDCHIMLHRQINWWKHGTDYDRIPLWHVVDLFNEATGYKLIRVSGMGVKRPVCGGRFLERKIDYSGVPRAIKKCSTHYALDFLCRSAHRKCLKQCSCMNCGATPRTFRELRNFMAGDLGAFSIIDKTWRETIFCSRSCAKKFRHLSSERFACSFCGKRPRDFQEASRWFRNRCARWDTCAAICSDDCFESFRQRAASVDSHMARSQAGRKSAATKTKRRMAAQLQQIESFVSSKLQEAQNV